jgi:hypothetical protein
MAFLYSYNCLHSLLIQKSTNQGFFLQIGKHFRIIRGNSYLALRSIDSDLHNFTPKDYFNFLKKLQQQQNKQTMQRPNLITHFMNACSCFLPVSLESFSLVQSRRKHEAIKDNSSIVRFLVFF